MGKLEFHHGVPTETTADKLFEFVDFMYAYRAFMDNMRGVSIHTIRKGLNDVGIKDGEVLIFSELMDSNSLFLTANCDTIYAMGSLDLTKGPIVVERCPSSWAPCRMRGFVG